MLNLNHRLLGLCAFVVAAGVAINGAPSRSNTLSAMDQIEIQQLVATAHHALATGEANGYTYAGLFTGDGVSDAAVGREQLAALARGGRKGVRTLNTNVIIEPSSGGASGKQYEFVVNFLAEGREPVSFGATGRFEDTYVKTRDGWRIKTRHYLTSISTPDASKVAVQAPPAATGQTRPPAPPSVPFERPRKTASASTLSAMDYLEIQQLVASYGHALDNGIGRDDNGEAYAGLFAPDGVFGRPYTTGHDELVKLAHTQPHNRQYIRHFLANTVIEPSPEGAVGRQYLVVLDTAANGKPGSVLLGGHYEDTYVKTSAGWRFKSRTLYPARTGPQPSQTSSSTR